MSTFALSWRAVAIFRCSSSRCTSRTSSIYSDPQFPPKQHDDLITVKVPKSLTLDELLKILVEAKVYLERKDPDIL